MRTFSHFTVQLRPMYVQQSTDDILQGLKIHVQFLPLLKLFNPLCQWYRYSVFQFCLNLCFQVLLIFSCRCQKVFFSYPRLIFDELSFSCTKSQLLGTLLEICCCIAKPPQTSWPKMAFFKAHGFCRPDIQTGCCKDSLFLLSYLGP